MAQKCVHKGCGKTFTDPEEACVYHPGPPIFHEGQKGWKCCKPRVLTFDEFLEIPPCTTGKHSIVDDTPVPEKKPPTDETLAPIPIRQPKPTEALASRAPQAVPAAPSPRAVTPEPESDSDNPSLPIPPKVTCRRRGCNANSSETKESREGEECVHHPGHPIFHEGSKGWSCCKKRVLDFDEFMQIEGCKTKQKHMFVGSGKIKGSGDEKVVDSVRHDFYQTGTTVHASLYLKKISKTDAKVEFASSTTVDVDLPTVDNTRYKASIPLYGPIEPSKSSFRILGTKLELTLAKADGFGWPVLRADEPTTGEIIQTGRAGNA